MTKAQKGFFLSAKESLLEHSTSIAVISILVLIVVGFHILDWWEVLGLIALKFGLGVKVGTAKTFAAGVVKAGGKKALLYTTGGMLLKRHIIDLSTKFFTDHSVGMYKKNIVSVFKLKFSAIKNSSPMQRAKAVAVTLLGGPIAYLFWTKALGAVVQKVFYKALYPVFLFLWTIIINSLGFLGNMVGFLFQLIVINMVIDNLEKYRWGRAVLKGITNIIHFFGDIFTYVNKIFIFLGFDVKLWLVRGSIKFNRWLESILDKGLNAHKRVKMRRERHITAREDLIMRREARKAKRVKKVSMWKKTKTIWHKKVLKKTTWREKREARAKKRNNNVK